MFIYLTLGICAGWFSTSPLLRWATHLLSGVAAADAAPSALTRDAARLSPTVERRWALALRWGLLALTPLALWRGAVEAHHLPVWLGAGLLAAIVGLLALVAAIDGSAHLIFAEVVALPAGLALLGGLVSGTWPALLLGGAVDGGIMGVLYLAGQLIYGTDALGWGDVQLGVALGIVLGWGGFITALVWGMLLMAGVTLALLAARRITARSFLPLGSFIIAGAVLALLVAPPPWL
jgi:prepilin signal peptidase PulO-like enzyme (type II secretory pathway)